MTVYDVYKGKVHVGTIVTDNQRHSSSDAHLVNTFGTEATEHLGESAEEFIVHARIDWSVVDVVEAGEPDCPWRLQESSGQQV